LQDDGEKYYFKYLKDMEIFYGLNNWEMMKWIKKKEKFLNKYKHRDHIQLIHSDSDRKLTNVKNQKLPFITIKKKLKNKKKISLSAM